MTRLTSRIVSCMLVLAACSFSAGAGTTAPQQPTPSSSSVPPTTATPSSTPTDTTILDGGDSAEGSGCSPGTDGLPDGLWFGFAVEAAGEAMGFDLACWFTGDAAIEAAAEDGAEPPPNGYHVRNASGAIRSVPVEPSAVVTWYPDVGDPATELVIGYVEWASAVHARGIDLGIWITVEDGHIVEVLEQWVP